MNRNVTFTFAADPLTLSLCDHMLLHVVNPDSTPFQDYVLAPTQTTVTIPMPVGNGYTATLKAANSTGQFNAMPPTVTFDVPAPPPTIPGNPTLNPPTVS